MSDITLNPYLFFRGDAKAAMEFYKSVFGGELTMQTHAKALGDQAPADWGDKLMHAELSGGEATLYASDTKEASEKAAKVTLSLGGSDEAKLSAIFDGLGVGGNVHQPLKKEFWGDTFGMLTDKYGVEWMVNINAS